MIGSDFVWKIQALVAASSRIEEWRKKARQKVVDYAAEHAKSAPGPAKAMFLSIASLLKADTPHSVELFKHYVGDSGKPYELTDIPPAWQDWIVKQTGGRAGVYKDLSPYNAGTKDPAINDLRNTLGHFNVEVVSHPDGSKTYNISDEYKFDFKPHDTKQEGRHGFPLTDAQAAQMKDVPLPSMTYRNPGGFDEKFEIKKVGKETFLYVPQPFLKDMGTPFEVKGSFTRGPHRPAGH